MLEGGFILLHRSILRWEWYGDLNTARLFIHLLLTVNYEPQRWQGINGTSLSVVKHGNTQVWKRAPEYLYNNGDQCSGFTGGWDARAAYFLNTDTYYRNQTGTKPVFNTGNISVTCTGSYLGGGSVITNWPVDLSAVSSLTASINKFDPTETYSAFNIYLLSAWPTINADNSYVAAVRVLGNQQATSVTLNTSGYNGSYYVLMGFSNNNSRSFTGYIYSLKCNF